MKYCNERTIGICPDCNAPIKIAWSVNQEALPDGGTHKSVGDWWKVTKKCEHITLDGGNDDGLDYLLATLEES